MLALACAPDSEEVGVFDDGTTDGAADSSGTDGPATLDGATTPGDDDADDGDTAADDDDTADDGDTTADDDDSTSEPGTTDAGTQECIEEDWPACEVEACVQEWSFACEACSDEESQSHPLCFGVSEGCAYPWLDCPALPESPCGRVWGQGSDMIESFEDEAAAVCVLEALRDGVPGTYELVFGIMFDVGPANVEVLVGADRSAVMQWDYECMNCFGGGDNGRSGTMALQPAAYFEDCLEAPTTETLTQCIFGFVDIAPDGLPPKGWTPPFTTGDCSALEFACPPA